MVPTYEGRRGHPVLFGANHFLALRALEGDQGARSVLTAAPGDLSEVGCDHPGIFRDIDTPEDLSRERER